MKKKIAGREREAQVERVPPPPIPARSQRSSYTNQLTASTHSSTRNRHGCKLGWKLIGELQLAAENLSSRTPVADTGDELAAYSWESAKMACQGLKDEEIWENVNPQLDQLLGFRCTMVEVEKIVW
jgi:hypothetical protein